MNCRDIEKNLPAYLEDLLPEEEKVMVREHLASCRKCGKALEDLKSMDTLLQNLEEVAPPPWLKQKIMAQVREEAQPEKGFFHKLFTPLRFKIPLQAVAMLLITVLAVYLDRGEEPELRKKGIVIVPPAATLQQSLEKSEKPRIATSQPIRQKEPPLPKESQIREEIKPETAKSVDGDVLALKKDFSTEKIGDGEEKQEKVKAKSLAGLHDSSGPGYQGEMVKESQFKAQRNDIAIAPLSSRPSAGIMMKERKAETALEVTAQVLDRRRAVEEVVNLLQQFDAEQIELSVSGEREILTAVLPHRHIKPFLRKLDARSGIEKKVSLGTGDTKKGTVDVRIEILPKP